jgi:hypothetical protein
MEREYENVHKYPFINYHSPQKKLLKKGQSFNKTTESEQKNGQLWGTMKMFTNTDSHSFKAQKLLKKGQNQTENMKKGQTKRTTLVQAHRKKSTKFRTVSERKNCSKMNKITEKK